MNDDKPYAETPLFNRGDRVAYFDPKTGSLIGAGYVKEWRSVNDVCTITTVASLDDLGIDVAMSALTQEPWRTRRVNLTPEQVEANRREAEKLLGCELPPRPTSPTACGVTDDEIDDRIDEWHNGAGAGKPLHEYLGWTRAEYAKWVENPDAIPGCAGVDITEVSSEGLRQMKAHETVTPKLQRMADEWKARNR